MLARCELAIDRYRTGVRVRCPKCGEAVGGGDIDLPAGRALCRPCGELFGLPDVDGDDDDPPAPVRVRSEPTREPPLPTDLRWRELDDGGGRRFEIRPSRLTALPLLGFAVIWNAFMVNWYRLAFSGPSGEMGGIAMWFPLGHVAAGIVVTWMGLTRLLNHHFIRLDRDSLHVGTRPLPGRSHREPTSNIDRFEAGEAHRWASKDAGARYAEAPVVMITHDHRSVVLRLPLGSTDEAAFVASRLNAALALVQRRTAYRG